MSETPLEKARRVKQQNKKRGKQTLTPKQDPIEKAKKNPTRKNCIDGYCFDCLGRRNDPRIEWRIGNCLITDCPLWPVRPYQKLYDTEKPKSLKNYQ